VSQRRLDPSLDPSIAGSCLLESLWGKSVPKGFRGGYFGSAGSMVLVNSECLHIRYCQ
jgi:hypothetical protein